MMARGLAMDPSSTGVILGGPIASPGFVVIWEFLVKPEARTAFEKIYNPEGGWAQLFRQSPEFLGTHLLRDVRRPQRYRTFDKWTSRDAFLKFRQSHQSAYAALDQQCATLTDLETPVGEFELSGVCGQ